MMNEAPARIQNRNILAQPQQQIRAKQGGQRIFEKNQKSLFQEIEQCKQYCETHYYEDTTNKDFKKLSKRSEFYASLINHILKYNPKDMKNLQFLT